MSDSDLEQEIQAKGLNAPRVSLADVHANIKSEHYFTALDAVEAHFRRDCRALSAEDARELGRLTFCVLVLNNGFIVTGESACVSLDNFDFEIGCKAAKENAVNKIWPLMGYELRSKTNLSE